MSAAQYTYEANWSEEERSFIARVREFPSLEARGDSRGGALRALKSVVDAVAKDLANSGAGSREQPELEKTRRMNERDTENTRADPVEEAGETTAADTVSGPPDTRPVGESTTADVEGDEGGRS